MSWFDLVKYDVAEFNDGLLICSKHRYGPIDVWYDCNECLQEWNEFEAKLEGFGMKPKEIKDQKKHFVDVRGSTKNIDGKKRWIWIKDSELEEHVDRDSHTYRKFRGLI